MTKICEYKAASDSRTQSTAYVRGRLLPKARVALYLRSPEWGICWSSKSTRVCLNRMINVTLTDGMQIRKGDFLRYWQASTRAT